MRETDRIANQIERAYRDGFWGGGPVGGLLRSLRADEAIAYPITGAHSVWEIALHVGLWHDIFRGRATGENLQGALESDWPAPSGASDRDWEAALSNLEQGLDRLVDAVRKLDPEQLHTPVSGRPFTVYEMLHGITQHDQYHAGQVLMLKKVLRGTADRGPAPR